MKIFVLLSFIALNFSMAQAQEIDRDGVRKGIELLFQKTGQESEIDIEKLTDQAIGFKKRYDETVAGFQMTDLKTKKLDLNTTEFQYSSAVQIPGAKSNTVYGYIYQPLVPLGCTTKFPATLFIHHVANKIDQERLFASMAARWKKGVVMLIFLPDYGPRKEDPAAPPFASELPMFKEKLFQALVDIRTSGELLKKQEDVDPNQMQLGGLSLGGLVAAMSAGIDPFFNNYMISMGGGDIANVLGMDKAKKTTSEVRKALANINWDLKQSRQELSALDPITWAYSPKGKKFTFVNSKEDELIDNEMSVQKLIRAYRENGNDVTYMEHHGGHVPEPKQVGLKATIQIYYRVLASIVAFLGESQSGALDQCKLSGG